jgi:hypothetical protein
MGRCAKVHRATGTRLPKGRSPVASNTTVFDWENQTTNVHWNNCGKSLERNNESFNQSSASYVNEMGRCAKVHRATGTRLLKGRSPVASNTTGLDNNISDDQFGCQISSNRKGNTLDKLSDNCVSTNTKKIRVSGRSSIASNMTGLNDTNR